MFRTFCTKRLAISCPQKISTNSGILSPRCGSQHLHLYHTNYFVSVCSEQDSGDLPSKNFFERFLQRDHVSHKRTIVPAADIQFQFVVESLILPIPNP